MRIAHMFINVQCIFSAVFSVSLPVLVSPSTSVTRFAVIRCEILLSHCSSSCYSKLMLRFHSNASAAICFKNALVRSQ